MHTERERGRDTRKEATEKELDVEWLVYWRVVFAISPFNCRPCIDLCVCMCAVLNTLSVSSHFMRFSINLYMLRVPMSISLLISLYIHILVRHSSPLLLVWLGNGCVFLMTPIYNVGDDFDNRRALDSKLHRLNNTATPCIRIFRPFQ